MHVVVLAPTPTRLVEVVALRRCGPPRWIMSPRERRDRVRAAISNSGFAVPTGEVHVGADERSPELDLAVALAVLLTDPSHEHLRRPGWIAWGGLRLDGGLLPVEESFVNDLPRGPCAGRIWEPEDRVPDPDEDAVMSIIDVSDLKQAWDAITFLAGAEEVILGSA